ncbi:MAG: PfkB family carbohydrate kinase [Herbinix sp.]|nr:PfkB family carbohydrate kinase [Herbinix sp.]
MIKVLGIGDNVVDMYMHISTMYPGGNALNFSVYASMLGAEAAYMGVFGDDDAAKHVYHTADSLGINLSHSRFYKGENGYAQVKLVEGDRIFIGSNKGGVSNKYLMELTELDEDYISQFDVVHTSIFSYLESQLPTLRRCAGFISMDFSDSASEEYYKQCAPYIDCASISCSEMVDEDIVALMNRIVAYGCKHIVIATRGSRGALVLVDGKMYEQSPCLVDAKDTMGAGDSFITSFLTNYIDEMKNAVDYSEISGTKGITKKQEFQDIITKVSLYKAGIFSSKTCGIDGAFGYGKVFENN